MTPTEINKRIAELKGIEWNPEYSGDYWAENIGLAWELFEELPYSSSIWKRQDGWYEVNGGDEAYNGFAKTATRAICLAWINWIENL
ncbi:MAG: hypothetical protein AB7O96_00940 [Pseudobdellovibrionaceae bacterium]